MKPVTAIIAYTSCPSPKSLHDALIDSPSARPGAGRQERSEKIRTSQWVRGHLRLALPPVKPSVRSWTGSLQRGCGFLPGSHPLSLSFCARNDDRVHQVRTGRHGLHRLFRYERRSKTTMHPLNDYQKGSVRDSFKSRPSPLLFVLAARKALRDRESSGLGYAGLYDLRLRISVDYSIHHVAKPLYVVSDIEKTPSGSALFSYVNPPKTLPFKRRWRRSSPITLRESALLCLLAISKLCKTSGASFPQRRCNRPFSATGQERSEDAVQSASSQKTNLPL